MANPKDLSMLQRYLLVYTTLHQYWQLGLCILIICILMNRNRQPEITFGRCEPYHSIFPLECEFY